MKMKNGKKEEGQMQVAEAAVPILAHTQKLSKSQKRRRNQKAKKSGQVAKINVPILKQSSDLRDLQNMPSELSLRPDLKKYWLSRKELFSKFNRGIKLDTESWFSVTPEVIARHTAYKCAQRVGGVILDAFCGCGGNTIQFAKRYQRVIAIDIDPRKIEYCKQNAKIYGVEDRIEFIVGDFKHLAPYLKADVVFLSPPWGGPQYSKVEVFNIETMIPMNGIHLFELAQKISPNIAYYLPRNVNTNQIVKLAGAGNYVDIEENRFKTKIKAITAYYGNLVNLPESKLDDLPAPDP